MIFHCRLAFRQIAKLLRKTDFRERQPLAVVTVLDRVAGGR
jgi:hypothetical protein